MINQTRKEGRGILGLASLPLTLLIAVPILALVVHESPAALAHRLLETQARRAAILTLETTTVAASLCFVLGLPVALLLARYRFPGREALDTLIDLPITLPPVVLGVALILAFGRMGIIGRYLSDAGIEIAFTRAAVVIAQLVIGAPFFVKTARAGFEAVDPRLEQAARGLGAGPWRTFWRVTFPLARPSLIAGASLAWARALSEFGATMMFAGNLPGRTQTLSLAVMSAMESDLDTAVSIAVLSLILGLAALFTAKSVARRWGVPGA